MPDVDKPITGLVSILHRRAHVYFGRRLRPYELNFTHFRMMKFLTRHPGTRQEDIRCFIDADKGGVAHAVKGLVDKGYVSRERDPEDRRAYVIYITDAGMAFLGEFEHVAREFNQRLTEGFSAEETKMAKGLMQRMIDNTCDPLEDDCSACGRPESTDAGATDGA